MRLAVVVRIKRAFNIIVNIDCLPFLIYGHRLNLGSAQTNNA